MFHRVGRLPGSSYSIAAGFACGAAASFTPFIGLHFVLAAILAWIIRANIVTSAIGTIVGNPWTFPFIWVWIYNLGHWITDKDPLHAESMDFIVFFSGVTEATLRGDMAYLMKSAAPVLWPMFVGSLPTAVGAWVIFYFLLKPLVHAYQVKRMKRMQKKKLQDSGLPPEDGSGS